MKVLLLNPPYFKKFVRSSRCTWIPIAGSNWSPIFLAYATGLLEKNGHEAKLWDALVEDVSQEDLNKGVKDFSPELIVLYTSLDSLENDVKVAELIKKDHDCKMVFVGPWCATDPLGILNKSKVIDGVIRREFEYPVSLIAAGKDWADIPCLVWRNDERIVENKDDYFVTNEELEAMPFVTDVYRRHLNLKNYHQTSLEFPFVDLFTARGCAWGRCTFCLWPQTIHKGAPYRFRSIENVIEEIKFIKEKMPEVKEIFFQDDMLPRGRLNKLCRAMIDNNLKIKWSGYAKTDLDYETLRLAKESGCRFLHIGYETGNQFILDNIEKGEVLDKMEKFSRDAKKAGVHIHGDFIIGLPGETEETIKKTIAWAKKINISDYQFVIPQPHPSTKFYHWLKDSGHLTEDGKVQYEGLSPEKLEYWRFKAYQEIYFSPRYLFSRIISGFGNPKEFVRLFKVAKKGIPQLINNLVKYGKKSKN